MNSPIQEIKEKLDIVDFIRSYITIHPAGKNFKALCPFHKEKTPSFIVSPERQTWHCFGACSEGGDIFKFLMKYENLEFYEALKVLADKAGIELKKISPAEQKQFGVLYDINDSAKDFYRKELENSNNALNYLRERGLKKETVEEFELGLASGGFLNETKDNLTRHLINFGYDIKDIERAGLSFKTEQGNYIDRFRGRIMFPIHNHFGKVVGFSGRILPQLEKPEIGKYVNSPETLIYNKSRILYGFHKAKEGIRRKQSIVLVEGQMDFLMVYQEGIKNAVATSGTALTFDHLRTLRRLTDKIILYFDNDEAGLKAAERSIDLANNLDFNVEILTFKDYKDPAEIAQKSPDLLLKFIDQTKPAMEFYFERYLGDENDKKIAEEKAKGKLGDLKRNLRIILAKIKNFASSIERSHWLKQLSLRTKIEEKALAEEMERIKSEKLALNNEKIPADILFSATGAFSRRELIAQRLISLVLLRENLRPQINEYSEYLPADYSTILKGLAEKIKMEERLAELMNLISLRSSFELSVLEEEDMEREFYELLRQLRLEYLKEKRQKLVFLVRETEQKGDENETAAILKEFNEVSKLMLE